MATYTKNINLLKPAEQEKYDVNLRNNNLDKIDKAIGDGSDALKAHKNANPIDHPDGSVTTPKLRDKNVTTEKLADKSVTAAKLADDINDKLNNNYVQKAGDTMQGDLKFTRGQSAIKFQVNKQDKHSIGVGGNNGENLDLGSYMDTEESNLCCYSRPGWYGANKQPVFKPLMTIGDISVTYGNIRDGQQLPIPDGFREDECNWLLSMDQSNPDRWYLDIKEGGVANMINHECWRNGRTVHVGVRYKGQDSLGKNYYQAGTIGRDGAEVFVPGSANYICIAVKKA